MIQLFNEDDTHGKVVYDLTLHDEDCVVTFTDGSFIVIHAYATDGWHGQGSHEVEKDEYKNANEADFDENGLIVKNNP